MRISTTQLYTDATRNMLEGQSKLADIQNKISSGKNFTSLADDPVAANQSVNLKRELSQLDMFDTNIQSTRRRLEQTETVLSDLNNGLDRLRDLALQARNATVSDEQRKGIAFEMDQLVKFSANLMNTRDAKGEYLFSGSKGNTQAFALISGRYEYQGDSSEREIQIGSAQFVGSTDSGQALFQTLSSGRDNILNTAVDTINVLQSIGSNTPPTSTDIGAALDNIIDGVDETQTSLSNSFASLGARLNGLDAAQNSNNDFKLLTQSTLSSVEDLDYVSASTELARRQLGLEAAYASFAKIQGLSLFNYIS